MRQNRDWGEYVTKLHFFAILFFDSTLQKIDPKIFPLEILNEFPFENPEGISL